MHALMYLSMHRRATRLHAVPLASQGSPWSEMRGPPAAWAVRQERRLGRRLGRKGYIETRSVPWSGNQKNRDF